MNLIEQAVRLKLRFPSTKGPLNVESLFDLPLTSKTTFDLDTVARTINSELRGLGEESFVDSRVNPRKTQLELQMEVIKYVISERKAENEKLRLALVRKQERDRLQEVLADKQDEALRGMTEEQIKARLAELEG